MKISDNVRSTMDVAAIAALWFGVSIIVGLSGLGDCFMPGCGEAIDRRMRIEWTLVAIGLVSHIVGCFWLKSRRSRRP
ncbi:MAG TPA: hypothetical protein VID20_00790 [Sphingomicrobium sp.]